MIRVHFGSVLKTKNFFLKKVHINTTVEKYFPISRFDSVKGYEDVYIFLPYPLS